ncbi:hypothetical protein [Paenibacillus soyae]|uniref:Uncharacterized protein n=1 Tax=Paenibacillus soyae TaxID=2969249 RepID=A0A9X2MPU2_9BACL|nr:hypothetical protein [Paenibacillus soyae]MCR2804210.1 hypothetical protein [Paenibacillus soyae]
MSANLQVSHNRRRGNNVAGAMNGRRKHHHHHHHRRDDFAVEGIQDAGRVLGARFNDLRKRCKARRLVAAIRHCDARTIHDLFGHHCRVVCFFKRPGYDCVKLSCSFDRGAAVVTFDICVRSLNRGCGCGCGF